MRNSIRGKGSCGILPDDFRIECSSSVYGYLQVLAGVGCALYSVLIQLVYFWLLSHRKSEIRNEIEALALPKELALEDENGEPQPDRQLENIGFLYKSYVWWWWELVETLRKLLLTGVMVPIDPGSPVQSIILMSLALATSIMYHVFRPFRRTNLLGILSSYTVVFVSFSSLLLIQPRFLLF